MCRVIMVAKPDDYRLTDESYCLIEKFISHGDMLRSIRDNHINVSMVEL
jgi:hypothetical protein